MAFWPKPPNTATLSWQQMVQEADPVWQQDYRRPWVYEFSNGRLFYAPLPLYSGTATGTNTFLVHAGQQP